MPDEFRPIPDTDAAILRTIFRLLETDALDSRVHTAYWNLARTLSRVHDAITPRDLAYLALLLNRPTPLPATSFLTTLQEGRARSGDRVVAYFAKQWRYGRYQKLQGKKVQVMLDEYAPNFKEINPTYVRLPEKAELAAIGEI